MPLCLVHAFFAGHLQRIIITHAFLTGTCIYVCAASVEGQDPAKKSIPPVGLGIGRLDPCAWDFCPLPIGTQLRAMRSALLRSDPRALCSQNQTRNQGVHRATSGCQHQRALAQFLVNCGLI